MKNPHTSYPAPPLDELLRQASEAAARDEHARGIELALRAEALAREAHDKPNLVQALRLLVMFNSREGLAEQAISAGQAVLPMLREAGDDAARADVLCDMAMAFLDLGLNQEALDHISESVEAARACGDARLLCLAYNRVGLTKGHLGRYEEGERFLQESLRMARELGSEEETYRALTNLGVVASDAFDAFESRGDVVAARAAIERARRHGEEALLVARRGTGNAYREALTMSNLGRYLGVSGQGEAAFTLLDHARELARRHGHRSLVLACEGNRAELLVRQGRHDDAIAILTEALEGAQELYANSMVQDMHRQLYLAHKARGDFAEALSHHERYHALTREQLEQRNDAQSRLMMNRLELDQARFGAERSRMEAELQRVRAEQMAAEAERLQAQARELRRYVLADPLTGLGNRRQVERELPRLLQHSARTGEPIAAAMLDLDHFKRVNDAHGHAVGDAVLTATADLFRARVRGGDLIARLGGEEFLIVFAQASPDWAREACERLRAAVQEHDWGQIASGLAVTVSIGVCVRHVPIEATQLLDQADAALYAAKKGGRNRVVVADPPEAALQPRLL